MSDMDDWNKKIIDEFHANGGKVGGQFEGAPILLLHTTGAKSKQQRINPMMYLELDDRIYVFASKAGAPTNPDWYHNLIAHPDVDVEIGTGKLAARAVPVSGEQRDEIYAEQAKRYSGFAEYQEKTDRVIPVVELVVDG